MRSRLGVRSCAGVRLHAEVRSSARDMRVAKSDLHLQMGGVITVRTF